MRGAPEAKIRGRAALIGFSGARADTKIAALSGGEKARLLMGLATFDGPQLLILDEPTNHLDIDSRAELIEAINEYEGACILVSHDRRLLEACVDRLWLVADGTVKTFDGDLADYGRFVLGQRAPRAARRPRQARRAAPEPREPPGRAAISRRCARRSSRSSRRCTASRTCCAASTKRWRKAGADARAMPRKWSTSRPSAPSSSAR